MPRNSLPRVINYVGPDGAARLHTDRLFVGIFGRAFVLAENGQLEPVGKAGLAALLRYSVWSEFQLLVRELGDGSA